MRRQTPQQPSRGAQKAGRWVRFGTELIRKSNAKPCINAENFLDSVQTVFRPNLAELWRLDEFTDEMTVLLIDNCPTHIIWVVM
jgi:hypothetical protein